MYYGYCFAAKIKIKKILVSAVCSGGCGGGERADSLPRPRIVPAQFTTATAQFTTATAILLNFLVSVVCVKVPVEVDRERLASTSTGTCGGGGSFPSVCGVLRWLWRWRDSG